MCLYLQHWGSRDRSPIVASLFGEHQVQWVSCSKQWGREQLEITSIFTYAHLIIYTHAHEYIHIKNHIDLYATVTWKLAFLFPFILILKASHCCFHLEQMKVQVTGNEEEGSVSDLLLISLPVKIEDAQVSHICGSILLSVHLVARLENHSLFLSQTLFYCSERL